MRTPYHACSSIRSGFLDIFAGFFGFGVLAVVLSFVFPTIATANDVVTPQIIQGYIAHADPAKALHLLSPILRSDPHSAKAWYLKAEALDALGNDAQAKIALGTAEHLSPAMPFANPRSLHELEQRVGLSNVQSSHTMSKILHALLWFLALAFIVGIIAYAYFRGIHGKAESLAESERQDALLAITQYLTGELDAARISADAHGDTARLASIEGWQKSLVDCAQGLRDAAKADLDLKQSVTKRCNGLLAEIRAQVNGQTVALPTNNDSMAHKSYGPKDVWVDNTADRDALHVGRGIGAVSERPTHAATIQPDSYANGNAGGSSFGSALENGIGMGLGIELAEDLLGGNRDSFGGDPFCSGSSSSSGFGGDDNGLSPGDGSGGADDGFDSGSGDGFSSDGGADDGLSSDDSGGADDGFSSGDDSSW